MSKKGFARAGALALCLAAAGGATGCRSDDGGGIAGVGVAADQPKITQSELRAYCPPVGLREGTAFFATYAKGGDGDPAKIVYQSAIDDVTRTCRREGGSLLMTVAAAGRVVPGPAGGAGTASLPIRVAVVQGGEVLYSKVFQQPVAVGSGAATQFLFKDDGVAFPESADRSVSIYVGFDAGPAKKPADDGAPGQ